MSDSSNPQLEEQVMEVIKLQKDLQAEEQQIMADPRFSAFLQKQKQVTEQISAFWKDLETKMIENDIKSIKGEWGYITIAERLNFKIDETSLPKKFFKKVVDTKRLADTFRLEGKPINGAEPYTTKYLTKRIKENSDNE